MLGSFRAALIDEHSYEMDAHKRLGGELVEGSPAGFIFSLSLPQLPKCVVEDQNLPEKFFNMLDTDSFTKYNKTIAEILTCLFLISVLMSL